jgi:hypothetical protein
MWRKQSLTWPTPKKRITGFSLHFTNLGREEPYDPAPIFSSIDPHGSFTYEKLQEDQWSYWIGSPKRLIVKIGLVELEGEDGTVDVRLETPTVGRAVNDLHEWSERPKKGRDRKDSGVGFWISTGGKHS